MFTRIYCLLVSVFVFNYCFAQEPSTTIQVIAKPKKEGVWIRWAPVNPTVWQLGNKYGYIVERFTVIAGGELENPAGEKLTATPLKVYPAAELEKLSNTVKEVSVIQELIYGEDSNTAYKTTTPSGIMARNNDLENKYGIFLLVCDLSPDVAKAAGLFFHDTNAVKGKRYIYRISIANKPANPQLEQGVVVVDVTDEKPLIALKDLKAEFRNKTVSLSWSTLLHSGIYSSYYIEKSSDGKNFKTITDLPYVHMSETPNTEMAFFVDSLDVNNKTYSYRISGNSPFGETGPPSNVASGEGKDDLSGFLVIREGTVLEGKKTRVAWEFPPEAEKLIAGFVVYRSNKAEGPYTALTTIALDKSVREYKDETPFYNTYYQIAAVDKPGKDASRSFPFLVQVEDNNPPAIPVELEGSINERGFVKISWQPNKDSDLMGYSVYRSNSLKEEFIEITQKLLTQPILFDSLNIKVLNKKIYYRIIAVDNNYNASEFSEVLMLTKPDVVPPIAPVFTKAEIENKAIAIQWVNSTSEDIAKVELNRMEKEDRVSRTIKTWTLPAPIETQYVDASLQPGKNYQYKLIVYDSTGNKSEAVSPQLYFETGYRDAVKDLTATVDRDAREVKFQWKNAMPAVKCTIYRSRNDEPLILYQTLEGNNENFADKNITINNHYTYKIQVTYAKGIKSLLSDEIKVVY